MEQRGTGMKCSPGTQRPGCSHQPFRGVLAQLPRAVVPLLIGKISVELINEQGVIKRGGGGRFGPVKPSGAEGPPSSTPGDHPPVPSRPGGSPQGCSRIPRLPGCHGNSPSIRGAAARRRRGGVLRGFGSSAGARGGLVNNPNLWT